MSDRLSPFSNLSTESSSISLASVPSAGSTKNEATRQTTASGNLSGLSVTIAPRSTGSILERKKAAEQLHLARMEAARKKDVHFFSATKKNSDQKRTTLPQKLDFTVRGQSLKPEKQAVEASLNHQPASSATIDSQITSFSKEVTPDQHTSNGRSAEEEIKWQHGVHPVIKEYFLEKKKWVKGEKGAMAAQAEEAKVFQAYEREDLIQTPLGPPRNNKFAGPLRKPERSELEDWTSVDFGEEQSAVGNPIPDLPNKPTPDALAIEIDRRAINKAMNDGSAILKDLKSTTQSMRDELAADAVADTMGDMIGILEASEEPITPRSEFNDSKDLADRETAAPVSEKDSFSRVNSENSLNNIGDIKSDDNSSISNDDALLTKLEGLPYKKNERTSIWRNVSAREAMEQVAAEKRAEDAKRSPEKNESSFTEQPHASEHV